ncbi:MAG: DUF3015 domain-containing protein [Pseudomonadales bacterium]|nr:DUF3015 domain-containing protein [Pseudomonadales bacterium]
MKRTIIALAFTAASVSSFAEAPGGANCGWGNMLFQGQSGVLYHTLASFTNGTTGNATFGMTSGTNGCSSAGTLSYGGKGMIDLSALMDEFSEDVARGDGEVISALAISMGVEAQDRAAFKAELHENFDAIFPTADVTAEDVMASIVDVMAQDDALAKYVS